MPNVYISAEVARVRELYRPLLERCPVGGPVLEWLERMAALMAEGHSGRHPGAWVEISNRFPPLTGRPMDEVFDTPFSLEDAKLTVAREHGHESWADAALDPDRRFRRGFEAAVDALVSGDMARLGELLDDNPELIRERSVHGHRATLLHYIAANGVETWRQTVPANAARIAGLLLERGAEVHAEAEMYGGGQTALDLLLTSAHPKSAGVSDEVAGLLGGAAHGGTETN